jgi:hypothetical protein
MQGASNFRCVRTSRQRAGTCAARRAGRRFPALRAATPPPPTSPPAAEPHPESDSPVRPYVLAHERARRQAERRHALLLALDGVDVGPLVIHGHVIGTPFGSRSGARAVEVAA